MPLYEYECDACGHRFEVIQKYADAPISTCPVCGGAVTKLFSSPAIQFKGSGFYITDYARSGKGESGKSDSANPSAGKSGGSGSSSESTTSTESAQASAESKADARSDAKKRESSSDTKSESKPAKTESAAPAAAPTKSSTP